MLMVEKQTVRRTIVVTWGTLATAAGDYFADVLARRNGPAPAIAVVNAPVSAAGPIPGQDDSAFSAGLLTALAQISPPNLGSLLAQDGWWLAQPRDLQLFLVADVVAGGEQAVRRLSQAVTDAAYRYLGLECAPTLIWLAAEDEATAVCLSGSASPPFAQNIVALSPLNEEGLRLTDVTALAQITGELLWCLIATPFQAQFADWASSPGNAGMGSVTPLTVAGLSVWEWSPAAALEQFSHRWLQDVLAFWLNPADGALPAERIYGWLQAQGLDREGLAGRLLTETPGAPAYGRLARHYPWPWRLPAYAQALKREYEADTVVVADYRQQAGQQVTAVLEETTARLADFVTELLAGQPVGGSALASEWLWSLATICDGLYEQMLDEAATYDGIDANLAEERGEVEAHLRTRLETWPGPSWRRWLALALRPWRWPKLIWRYWQVRQLGVRLAALLAQQSARQRQKGRQTVVSQTLAEIGRLARQWHGYADEWGEMLGNWQRWVIGQAATDPGPENPTVTGLEAGGPLTVLPLPKALYGQMIADGREEAALAAATVGGLGAQVRQLDERLLNELRRLATTRLEALREVTAVDVLAALHETPLAWEQWWQTARQMATPLWRYDESCLPETARRASDVWSCFVGAGASCLPDALTQAGIAAVGELEQAQWLESADRRRLIILRLRRGLTPEAMTRGVAGSG
jgi:hypothetical protein